jgi:6-phosphogluconolactonase
MKRTTNYSFLVLIIFLMGFIISCEKIHDYIDHGHHRNAKGYVYSMSNTAEQNSILVFKQDAAGKLSYKTAVASGGPGKGMGLGSQGALILDKNHKWMYAVNAGNNTISSFKVSEEGDITLHQTIHSGGTMPVSLTVHQSLLYVVNGGGNICGFKIASDGWLSKIEESSQLLSSETAGPAEILFKPDGSCLVVTEKTTNQILIFKVNANGVAQPPTLYPAEAQTPFGFVFAGSEYLVVTDAFSGMPNKSVVTSFSVKSSGVNLKSNIPINQTAACWVVLTKNEDFAYVTNTGSNSISSLEVKSNGTLHLVDSIAAKTGKSPTDICLSGNAAFVYNVNAMSGTIGEYRVLPNGRLHPIGDVSGLPLSAVGLAAF